jgi:putative ABC transport system substrate-binding protein
MRRREFMTLLGGAAAAWPLAARAQQNMPLIGFMDLGGDTKAEILRGLAENGFVEGRDFRGEDTWSNFEPNRQAAQANSLVGRGAALIVANSQATFAAKAATQSIPIVFQTVHDPVEIGLIQSFSRPGGNLTGVTILNTTLIAKRLEILRQLVPAANSIAYLSNSTNTEVNEAEMKELQAAARSLRVRLRIVHANHYHEIERAFATVAREQVDALILSGELLYWVNRVDIPQYASSHKVPTIYSARQYVALGGLINFGTRYADGWYTMGVYAARILKGEKASELPVQQITKTELVLNLQTAKALGLAIPPTLLARADDVIE